MVILNSKRFAPLKFKIMSQGWEKYVYTHLCGDQLAAVDSLRHLMNLNTIDGCVGPEIT